MSLRKIPLPDEWMGKPIKGSIKKALGSTRKKTNSRRSSRVTNTDIQSPENWILLEGRQHSSYNYPDLFVSMHRLSYDADVKRVAKELGLGVANTGGEQDGTSYIGDIDWGEALKLNLALGNITLNPRQGLDLLLDLKKEVVGGRNRKKLYDAKGNVIDADRLRILYNEIVEVREPWRAEWLDARFDEVNDTLQMSYGHELANGQLKPRIVEPLEDFLWEDAYFNIRSANKQGLATESSNKKELYFLQPVKNKVAWFGADSYGAYLGCVRYPTVRNSSLGVRAAREKI